MSFGVEGLITQSDNPIQYIDDAINTILHYWDKVSKKNCKYNLETFLKEFRKKFEKYEGDDKE